MWEYAVGRFGLKFARVLFGTLALVVVLGAWQGYHAVRHWWDGRQIDKVTAQRDTAIIERDVARTNAANSDTSADAAQAARASNDTRLPAVRKATADAVERATRDIEQTPAVAGTRPSPDQLHDDAEAAARYRSAASRLRGTGAR